MMRTVLTCPACAHTLDLTILGGGPIALGVCDGCLAFFRSDLAHGEIETVTEPELVLSGVSARQMQVLHTLRLAFRIRRVHQIAVLN